jgi:hypothetical protein
MKTKTEERRIQKPVTAVPRRKEPLNRTCDPAKVSILQMKGLVAGSTMTEDDER